MSGAEPKKIRKAPDAAQPDMRACGKKIQDRGYGTHKSTCLPCQQQDFKADATSIFKIFQAVKQLQTELHQVKSDLTKANQKIAILEQDQNRKPQSQWPAPASQPHPSFNPGFTFAHTPNPFARPAQPQPANRKIQDPLHEIVIENIPFTPNENTADIVMKIAKAKRVTLDKNEFKCFRAISKKHEQKRTDRHPKIIVTALDTKKDELRRKPALTTRELEGYEQEEDRKIYITENLTPEQSKLFHLARFARRVMQYKYTWTRDGKVYMRQDDGTAKLTIATEQRLQQLQAAAQVMDSEDGSGSGQG